MKHRHQRKGSAAIFLLILLVPLVGLLAFSVDYGYLLHITTDLQRASDQAALAGVQDLQPDQFGQQDLAKVRATVKNYVKMNMGESFVIEDADIEIGRYKPSTIYSNVEILNDGVFDTVRVTVRRDDVANTSVSLFFARLFDKQNADVSTTSTAVLQKARYLGPGAQVFPFAIQHTSWNKLEQGDIASIYGDGRMEDVNGKSIPGNWGTIDIGPSSNGTSQLVNQIVSGLTQSDISALNSNGRIPEPNRIDATASIDLNGDTGLSAGLKSAVFEVEGQMKVAPIYRNSTGHGGNLEFNIIGWATIEIVDSRWNGSKNTRIRVRKSYTYDGSLLPVDDLSDPSNSIEGAFTSPVLVQ